MRVKVKMKFYGKGKDGIHRLYTFKINSDRDWHRSIERFKKVGFYDITAVYLDGTRVF